MMEGEGDRARATGLVRAGRLDVSPPARAHRTPPTQLRNDDSRGGDTVLHVTAGQVTAARHATQKRASGASKAAGTEGLGCAQTYQRLPQP